MRQARSGRQRQRGSLSGPTGTKAEANGVEEFELVNTAGLKALEPVCRTERAGIALYRDHRQPRPYAFLSGRYRSSGRDDRFPHPVLEAAIDGHAVKLRTGGSSRLSWSLIGCQRYRS